MNKVSVYKAHTKYNDYCIIVTNKLPDKIYIPIDENPILLGEILLQHNIFDHIINYYGYVIIRGIHYRVSNSTILMGISFKWIRYLARIDGDKPYILWLDKR